MAQRGLTYEVSGARGLQGLLETIPPFLRREVGLLNQQTAFAIRAHARANAPRDRGDLVASISVQGKDLAWRVGVIDATIASRGGSNAAHLNPSVYGVWYEFGFVTRKIARHPFMGPAVDAVRGRHEAGLAAIMAKVERLPVAA